MRFDEFVEMRLKLFERFYAEAQGLNEFAKKRAAKRVDSCKSRGRVEIENVQIKPKEEDIQKIESFAKFSSFFANRVLLIETKLNVKSESELKFFFN